MNSFALLGDVQFLLITCVGSQLKSSVDYAEHALIENKPRLQWIGERLDEWTIKLRFHRIFCNPELELSRLKAAMARHEPLPFVLATGQYNGEFVIVELPTVIEQTDSIGGVIELNVTMLLKECPDPKGERRLAASKSAASALLRPSQPLPPAVKTGLMDLAKPNLPSTRLRDAMMAGRDVLGAVRTVNDVVSLGRQLLSNPLKAVEQLSTRGVPSIDRLARAADRFGVNITPLTGILADALPLLTMSGAVVSEARSARQALTGLTAENVGGRLDTVGGHLVNVGRSVDAVSPTIARLSAHVAVRSEL